MSGKPSGMPSSSNNKPTNTICAHFTRGRCAYGSDCIKQHGKKDPRPSCGTCKNVRVRNADTLCTKCQTIAEAEPQNPCDIQCSHGDDCLYGDRCSKDHNDQRPICTKCEARFIPEWAEGCKECTVWPYAYKMCFPKMCFPKMCFPEAKSDDDTPQPNTDDTCEYGDRCFRMHGYDDDRPICISCFKVRLPRTYMKNDDELPSKYCGECSHAYRTSRASKESRQKASQDASS